ncbi:MAG: hypothetical protein V2B20_00780, partial [Pseudomonadota bacterium]
FSIAFIVIFLATAATVFLGFGQPTQDERSFLFKTFIVEIGLAVFALFYALFGIKRGTNGAGELVETEALPESYAFSKIHTEISDTVSKLEADNGRLVQWYLSKGDGERLFDGLYSSLLYASSSAVTGIVDPRFYGNLMEWDSVKEQLRVRFFSGPYNDEIITRSFPLEGPGQGVASEAFVTGKVQIKNRMESELKEKGEARLNAMVSIPIPDLEPTENTRQIVILNIDAGFVHVFPSLEEWQSSEMKPRIQELRRLISRVNRLYRTHMVSA